MKDHPIFKLRNDCYDCTECPLGRRKVDGEDPHVFGTGRVNAKIVFVGEAPGKNEVLARKPLVGRAGTFYEEKILRVAGIERHKVFTTNAVLCRPNAQNRTPIDAEIDLCRSHLDAQICLIDPLLLVTLGNVPLFSVCERKGITKVRGELRWSRRWSNGKIYPVLPMLHPAYCLRGSGIADMQRDAEFLGKLAEAIRNKEELDSYFEVEEDVQVSIQKFSL